VLTVLPTSKKSTRIEFRKSNENNRLGGKKHEGNRRPVWID